MTKDVEKEIKCEKINISGLPAHASETIILQCCDSRKEECNFHYELSRPDLGIIMSLCLFK